MQKLWILMSNLPERIEERTLDDLYAEAVEAFDVGDFGVAIDNCDVIITKRDSDHFDSYLLRGQAFYKNSRRLQELNRIPGYQLKDDDELELICNEVNISTDEFTIDRLIQEYFKQAANDFERSVELNPNSYVAHCFAAQAYFFVEEPEKVLEHLDMAIRMKSEIGEQPKIKYLQAESLRKTCKFDLALKKFDEVIAELEPIVCADEGDSAVSHEKLVQEINSSEKEFGQLIRTYLGAIDTCDDMRKLRKATPYLEGLLKISPDIDSYIIALEVYSNLRDWKKVVSYVDQGMGETVSNPEHFIPIFNAYKAVALSLLKRYDEALKLIDKTIEIGISHEDESLLKFYKAICLFGLERYMEAEDLFRDVAVSNPGIGKYKVSYERAAEYIRIKDDPDALREVNLDRELQERRNQFDDFLVTSLSPKKDMKN